MTNNDSAGVRSAFEKMDGSQLTSHDDRDLLLELISHRLRPKRQKRQTMNVRFGCRPFVIPQNVKTEAAPRVAGVNHRISPPCD